MSDDFSLYPLLNLLSSLISDRPPLPLLQAIFVDKERGFAMARSNIRNTDRRMSFEINTLIADPSFDVWSLGCVLYQLSTPGKSCHLAVLV